MDFKFALDRRITDAKAMSICDPLPTLSGSVREGKFAAKFGKMPQDSRGFLATSCFSSIFLNMACEKIKMR
jgi:hypothetical protein